MENKELKMVELDKLKKELNFNELEERLEMINAAVTAASRCRNDGCNDACDISDSGV